MHLKISSPEAVIFDQKIHQVTLPSAVGEITILPGHQPLSTILEPGIVSISPAEGVDYGDLHRVEGKLVLSVSKGLILVDGESIVITTSVGVTSASESHEVLETMKAKLEEDLEAIKAEGNKQELEAAVANLEKVTADLRMAKFGKVR